MPRDRRGALATIRHWWDTMLVDKPTTRVEWWQHFLLKIFLILMVVGHIWAVIWMAIQFAKDSRTTHQRLRSTLTPETPISGFYGPGSWWAWLITLGMSHAHLIGALWKTGRLPVEWDYDLIAASSYMATAATDLIIKSRAVAQLGAAASQSALLPAVAAAEYVVWIGTGSLVFTVVVAFGGALSVHDINFQRIVGITIVPSLLAFVASFFTLRAHQAIAQTAPVFWCGAHKLIAGKWDDLPLAAQHFPASHVFIWTWLYMPVYWQWGSLITGGVTIVVLLAGIIQGHNRNRVLWSATKAGFFSVVGVSCLICLLATALFVVVWAALWLAAWWPTYIFALLPWVGLFPATNISVLEMDQIAALLAIAIAAAIRILRPTLKVLRSRYLSDSASYELDPLLPDTKKSEFSTGGLL